MTKVIHLTVHRGNKTRCGMVVTPSHLTPLTKEVTCRRCQMLIERDLKKVKT